MTCTHVLGLIDAGLFVDYPRAHLDAAWQHARQCATCGPALEAATALTADLAALPQPAPPPHVTATVLARIAQIDQAHSAPAAPAMPEKRARSTTREWPAWAGALGGLAAGLAIVLSMPPGDGPHIQIPSPRIGGGTAGLVAMPSTTREALALAAGLVLYAAGLFAPLGGRKRAITDRS